MCQNNQQTTFQVITLVLDNHHWLPASFLGSISKFLLVIYKSLDCFGPACIPNSAAAAAF